MAHPRSRPHTLAFIMAAAANAAFLLALSACASAPGKPADSANDRAGKAPSSYPPGAALPLSIGGRIEASDGDPLSGAVNCAAALSLTAQRLEQVSANPFGQEIAVIARARDHFLAEARATALGSDNAASSVAAAVERRSDEKRGEPGAQAQLAIACLRRFGEAVQSPARAVTQEAGPSDQSL